MMQVARSRRVRRVVGNTARDASRWQRFGRPLSHEQTPRDKRATDTTLVGSCAQCVADTVLRWSSMSPSALYTSSRHGTQATGLARASSPHSVPSCSPPTRKELRACRDCLKCVCWTSLRVLQVQCYRIRAALLVRTALLPSSSFPSTRHIYIPGRPT